MFVVFGSPRSGTTLLSTILDANDYLTVPDETDFIIPSAFIINRVSDERLGKQMLRELITSSNRFGESLGEYLTREEVNLCIDRAHYSIHSIVSGIYEEMAKKTGAKLAGDKSPNDLLNLRILVETGFFDSDIKVVHIVRDIRDVVLSLRKVHWNVDWNGSIETFFPRMWSDSNLYLYELLSSRHDQYLFLRYEDLITSTASTVQRIACFLGVPFQDKMLDESCRGLKQRTLHHHSNLSKPIQSDKVQEWKANMDTSTRRLCETQAMEALQRFGYYDNSVG